MFCSLSPAAVKDAIQNSAVTRRMQRKDQNCFHVAWRLSLMVVKVFCARVTLAISMVGSLQMVNNLVSQICSITHECDRF